jgi:hypothetical protein
VSHLRVCDTIHPRRVARHIARLLWLTAPARLGRSGPATPFRPRRGGSDEYSYFKVTIDQHQKSSCRAAAMARREAEAGARSNPSFWHHSRATISGDPTPSTGSTSRRQFRLSLGSTPLSRDCGAGFFAFDTPGTQRSLWNQESALSLYFGVFLPKFFVCIARQAHTHPEEYYGGAAWLLAGRWEIDSEIRCAKDMTCNESTSIRLFPLWKSR